MIRAHEDKNPMHALLHGDSAGSASKDTRPPVGEGDRTLVSLFLALSFFGLVMIYSASSTLAWEKYGDPLYFVKKQTIWAVLGIGLFLFLSRIHLDQMRKLLLPMAGVIFALLVSVLLFGREVNGANRWLRLGPLSLQPSEMAKLFVVIYLAHYIAKRGETLSDFSKGLFPVLCLLGAFCFVIWREPDLGTTITILLISGILLFIGGASLRHLARMSGVVMIGVIYSLIRYPYMLQRVKTYINPLRDPPAKSFQINQSFIALGSGGGWGVGLGEGRQKLFYLPQPHTDFIFSVIGEELGFIGTLCVILLFLGLLWKGVQIARAIYDPFAQMLAIGTTLLIVMPALMNMGVVTGLLPTKGLPLPFISYGGSSLVLNWGAAGLLYRVSKEVPSRRSRSTFKPFFGQGS